MAEPKKIGRPTKCTPEAIETICTAISQGMPKNAAFALADIDEKTARNWEEQGAEGIEPYATFLRRRARATAEHIELRLARLDTCANDLWKREAWMLERLHPKEFATITKNQISGPDGGPVQTQSAMQVVLIPKMLDTADEWAEIVKKSS